MRLFSSQPEEYVIVALTVSVQEEVPAYCRGPVCVCSNNCHNNDDYHLTFTTWNGAYPQLDQPVDDDLFERAMAALGVS